MEGTKDDQSSVSTPGVTFGALNEESSIASCITKNPYSAT